MKVSELEGGELDVYVARGLGLRCLINRLDSYPPILSVRLESGPFRPSFDWVDGGPIIEKEVIAIYGNWIRDGSGNRDGWIAVAHDKPQSIAAGATPLVAAMRAFVMSKFGEEVPNLW